MAVPKKKTSRMRRNMRRSHDSLKAENVIADKESGNMRRSHHIDMETGMYRGRQILTPKEDA
ncbi:MAG: 50S ribosomal protein L32 [Alphaproteobacteria bacterium]|jgi:large subunit ribosomal protein L32